jgi:hypothetical protein
MRTEVLSISIGVLKSSFAEENFQLTVQIDKGKS